MEVDKIALGERIKNIRKKHHLTMEELADQIGSGKSNVSKWERGLNVPNYKTLKKISDIDKQTVNQLLYGSYAEYIKCVIEENTQRNIKEDALLKTIEYFNQNNIEPYNEDDDILHRYQIFRIDAKLSDELEIFKEFSDKLKVTLATEISDIDTSKLDERQLLFVSEAHQIALGYYDINNGQTFNYIYTLITELSNINRIYIDPEETKEEKIKLITESINDLKESDDLSEILDAIQKHFLTELNK